MQEIINILVGRDGMSIEEAKDLIRECRSEIFDLVSRGGSYDEATEIIEDYLGLEPDYLEHLGLF